MNEYRFALLTDGRADTVLVPPIKWLLHQKLPDTPTQVEWADLAHLPKRPKGLARKIQAAIDFYECHVLLVHRDAETEPREKRVTEIREAITEIASQIPYVCVVTVRMQEAWMLIDESAIRRAAGNPNGSIALQMPKATELESLPDPKAVLYDLLRKASELGGRRLKKFPASARAHRVAELIDDWKPLRKLSAFLALEKELDQVLSKVNRLASE